MVKHYQKGRTQRYSTVIFDDSHINYGVLSGLIEDVQNVHGTFAISDERIYLGIPVGKKVGGRRVKTGILGLYLEERQNSVTVAFKHFGKRSQSYANAFAFITENVVEEGARKTYIDRNESNITIPPEITFHRRLKEK